MTFGPDFEQLQRKTEEWRERLFKPLLKLLLALHVSANDISTFRIILAAAFPWLITTRPQLAWWCMGVSIALDALDGAVARYAKKDSDRGKFIDVLADQITFSLLAVGMIRIWTAQSLPLAFLALLIPATYLMVAVAKNERLPSDWLIKPRAQLTAYKIAFLLILAGDWKNFWTTEQTTNALWSLIALCALHFSWRYLRFIRKS